MDDIIVPHGIGRHLGPETIDGGFTVLRSNPSSHCTSLGNRPSFVRQCTTKSRFARPNAVSWTIIPVPVDHKTIMPTAPMSNDGTERNNLHANVSRPVSNL